MAARLVLLASLLPSGTGIKVTSRYPTEYPTPAPTPGPTYPDGLACPCLENACFISYDRDSNGCLDTSECNMQVELQTNCQLPTWDTDGDGCINETVEWPVIFAMTNGSVCPVAPVDAPPACELGHYLTGNPVACEACLAGETRRRRSLECTDCPRGKFDGGDLDDCIDSSSDFTSKDLDPGSNSLDVNGGADLDPGDDITVRGPPVGEDCVPSATVNCTRVQCTTTVVDNTVTVRGRTVTIDPPLCAAIPRFSSIVQECTTQDGTDLSRKYTGNNPPICACGDTECTNLQLCLNVANGTATCLPAGPYPTHPTPAPTVGAHGDPHLVNLQGEHFDINHAGEFTLLRLPQAVEKPAEFALRASIRPESGKPCTTYITEVEFSGEWFGGKTLHLRSYLRSSSNKTADAFLGARLVDGDAESAWEPIEMFAQEQVLTVSDSKVEIVLSKSEWYPKKRIVTNAPTVAGMFTLYVRDKKNSEGAKVIVRQDLPEQEHLNVAMRRLSTLGRLDVGGLLGFDSHPANLEYVSAECNHHKATTQSRVESQSDHSGYYYRPTMKDRWNKIRHRQSENPRDNEAAATLVGSSPAEAHENLMCKCPFSVQTGLELEGVLLTEDEANYLHAQAQW